MLKSWPALLCIYGLCFTTAAAETFSTWKERYFTNSQLAQGIITTDNADPDNDGLNNLLEYAYGSNPLVADKNIRPFTTSDSNVLTFTHRQIPNSEDLVFTLEASSDLTSWQPLNGVTRSIDSSFIDYDLITLVDPQILTGINKRFLRLRVETLFQLSARPDDAAVLLFWNAASDATKYVVLYSFTSGGPYLSFGGNETTQTNLRVSGADNGTTFYFIVRAFGGLGGTNLLKTSNEAFATPIAAPATPLNFVAEEQLTQIALSWSSSTGATSYKIRRKKSLDANFTVIADLPNLNYSDTDLSFGEGYQYTVAAVNSAGESFRSRIVQARFGDKDLDSLPNDWELANGTDPFLDDSELDPDNDGLNNIEEFNANTLPLNPDTNGNGMNDGDELNAGGTPAQPGPPPPPVNTPAPPGQPEPPSDPPLPPPAAIGTPDYDILVESTSIAFPKHGFATFQVVTPPQRYLTKTSVQTFSGGNPESTPDEENGTRISEIDPLTGEQTDNGPDYVGEAASNIKPTSKSERITLDYYDDDPNARFDEPATRTINTRLSEESTTEQMVTNGISKLPAYTGTFSPGTPSAYRNIHENELKFDYRITQFKFKWKPGTLPEQYHSISYLVIFIPEDDPETSVDESDTPEVVQSISWNGQGAESPVFSINPDSLKGDEDGSYQLVSLGLSIETQSVTLLDTQKWEPILPTSINSLPISNYKFETRRIDSNNWYSMQSGSDSTYQEKARVAGKFKVRASVTINGKVGWSDEKSLEVGFPIASTILNGQGVRARMSQAWQSTLNATTPTSRREEGYYITLNTDAETYGITAYTVGSAVGNNEVANINMPSPRPADIPATPLPNSKPVYTVAIFHTHTPRFYISSGRGVGPSDADASAVASPGISLPGFVQDYVGSPTGSNTIPAGHPLNSESQVFFITPPAQRLTP